MGLEMLLTVFGQCTFICMSMKEWLKGTVIPSSKQSLGYLAAQVILVTSILMGKWCGVAMSIQHINIQF